MTAFGPSVAQSVAGVQQAAHNRLRKGEQEKTDKARDRRKDEVELHVDQAELAEAVRNLKDNAREEAREDRQGKAGYGPDRPPAEPKRVDIEG